MNEYRVTYINGDVVEIEAWTPELAQAIAEEDMPNLAVVSVALLASQPAAWKAALFGGKIINYLPTKWLPIPPLRAWEAKRTLPEWRGGNFRKWLKGRAKPPAEAMPGAAGTTRPPHNAP